MRFASQQRQEVYGFSKAFKLTPRPALSMKVKILRHETDHSLPPSAEVKNVWSYTLLPYVLL
jgi:hypothetical protein